MPAADLRRPAAVTRSFGERLAGELTPFGFVPRANATTFVRRRGKITHRVTLSSSHRNFPGDVTCWVALTVEDAAVRALEPTWVAGGALGSPAFGEEPPSNIANAQQANALFDRIMEGLGFFDLVDDATRVAHEVGHRYVAGMVEPRVVVPYLRSRLGIDAVASYAEALLCGRPELWPAFVGQGANATLPRGPSQPDQGTELAAMMAKHAQGVSLDAPADSIRSVDLGAANLRCFLGLLLRGWGEPEAAALLRRVSDDRVRAIHAKGEAAATATPMVDDVRRAELVLAEVTGHRRRPRRSTPMPRLFQYHVLHAPFTPR